jgi:hypothetical protein
MGRARNITVSRGGRGGEIIIKIQKSSSRFKSKKVP